MTKDEREALLMLAHQLKTVHSPGHGLSTPAAEILRNTKLLDSAEYKEGFRTAASDAIGVLEWLAKGPHKKDLKRYAYHSKR